MATYGNGQMLGAGIDPRMFVQDYSGYAQAGMIEGQGMANVGAQVGDIAKQFGDYKKKQSEDERMIQKSESVAKAIGDLIPELQPTIQSSMMILGDKNIPLNRRKAEAEAIADILNLGINEVRNRAESQAEFVKAQREAGQIAGIENIYRGNEVVQMGRTKGGQLIPVGELVQGALPQDETLQPLPPEMLTEADTQGMPVEQGVSVDGGPGVLPPKPGATLGVGPRYRDESTKQLEGAIMTPEQLQKQIAAGMKVSAVPTEDGNYRVTKVSAGGGPLVEVNTGEKRQGERESMIDKSLITVKENAAAAAAQKAQVKEVVNLLNEGVKTGFGQDVIMKGRRILGKDVANQEQFKAASGRIAMGFINLTKGAISDREMQYFTEVLAPNIGTTVEGNKKIAEFLDGAVQKAEKIESTITEGMRTGKSPFDIDQEVQRIRNESDLVEKATTPEEEDPEIKAIRERLNLK